MITKLEVGAYLEKNNHPHADFRPNLVLVNSPSIYKFNQETKWLLCDSLHQFESWEDKQRYYISKGLDIYLPPDVYEALARHQEDVPHDKFK